MSGAQAAEAPPPPPEKASTPTGGIRKVDLHGLVVMQIIRHCQDSFPMTVAGQLLGMTNDACLEVTHAYPFPPTAEETPNPTSGAPAGEGSSVAPNTTLDRSQYQLNMMRCIREVNIDYQVAGWYQSTGSQMGSFLSMAWIETQYSYQSTLRDAVCLVYDPVRTGEGRTLYLRALRLSDAFMRLWARGDFTSAGFRVDDISSDKIIEEVRLEISSGSSHMAGAALVSLEISDEFSAEKEMGLSRLDFVEKPILESTMEYVINDMDELGKEAGKYAMFVRQFVRNSSSHIERLRKRKAENRTRKQAGQDPLPEEDVSWKELLSGETPRLESKLLLKELSGYVDSIKTLTSEYIVKQSAIGAIQAED